MKKKKSTEFSESSEDEFAKEMKLSILIHHFFIHSKKRKWSKRWRINIIESIDIALTMFVRISRIHSIKIP